MWPSRVFGQKGSIEIYKAAVGINGWPISGRNVNMLQNRPTSYAVRCFVGVYGARYLQQLLVIPKTFCLFRSISEHALERVR